MTDVNYTPEFEPADVDGDYGSTGGDITVPTFHDIKPFRFWCQKALPLVYDDSLSYYEVLCKVVNYLNNMMTDLTTGTGAITQFAQQFVINQQFLNNMAEKLGENTEELEDYINDRMGDFTDAYNELQNYVNQYFNNLDVQDEIDTKLDEMAESGQFNVLFDPVIQAWIEDETQFLEDNAEQQNTTLAQQNARIAVLEGRMDTFSSLTQGSTTGDAELADIRTTFFGENYSNAGDAVRAGDLMASGYIPLAFLPPELGTQNVKVVETGPLKGNRIAVVFNINTDEVFFEYQDEPYSQIYGCEYPSGANMHYLTTSDFDYVSDVLLHTYTGQGSGGYTPTRHLVIFGLPSDFPYDYLGFNPATNMATSPIEPNIIAYYNFWDKTQVDPTLSITGEAADAKATGYALSELNERLYTVGDLTVDTIGNDAMWESGTFTGTGQEQDNATRARIVTPLPCAYYRYITASDDLEFVVGVLTKTGTFSGYYNGATISSTGSWLSNVDLLPVKDYNFRLIIRLKATPTADIDPSIGKTDISFTSVLMNNIDKLKKPANEYNLSYVNVRPDNLLNADELIKGCYIYTDGSVRRGNDWYCTPFIDINGLSTLSAQNIGLGAWYDEDKAFISSVTLGNQQDVSIPSGAKYIRVSITSSNLSSAILSYHHFYLTFSADYPVNVWKSPKKGYEDGYIHFTVPVNNTVATYSDTTETNHEGTPDYVDVDCILSLPYKYKPVGEPCKLIMMCHGAGKGVTGDGNWTTVTSYNTLVSFFTSRGYAVFDCNGFKNDALGWSFWGNQRGLEAWRKAYLYVTNNYNVEKTFAIYAFSMGGLTAMNLAFQGFPNINCIAMGSPVLNLREVWNSTDGTKAVLKVLYGLGDEWDESKVVGDNPYKHIITTDGVDYCPYKLPPIKIWYGSTETNNSGNPAIEKEIARSFVNAIVNSGNYAFYREVSGRGHEICYGGSTVVNTEILTFIERYERAVPTYN